MNKKSPLVSHTIRIGITGHRILQNENLLFEKVKHFLNKEIFKFFDAHSKAILKKTPTPLINYSLITMLAEGADRLVARAVLDYNNTSSLEVVLPFSLSEYKKTFKNPNDKEFVELFQKAKRIISTETITRYSEQNLSEYIKTHPYESKELPGKNDAFKSAGMYMVDNSDLLIALWDGKTNHGKGGTKDIIDYAKEKGVSIIIIYTDADRPNKIMQGQSFLKLT